MCAHLPGGALDIDLNVRGLRIGADGLTKATATWSLLREGDGYRLHSGEGKTHLGGLHEFKLIIRRALDIVVEQVHPLRSNRWTQPNVPMLRVSVGERDVGGYATCALGHPETNAVASWADPSLLRLESDGRFAETAPVRAEGASPREAAAKDGPVLRLRTEREGYYLVSLLVGSPERAIGPCEVSAGRDEVRTMPRVATGEYGSWAIVGHANSGVLELTLCGDFRLAAVAVAPMMYENEDFLFRREWCLSTDFHPDDNLPR